MFLRHRDAAPSCWNCKHMQSRVGRSYCLIVTQGDGSVVTTGLARGSCAPCGPTARLFEPVTKQPAQGMFRCFFRRLRWCS